MRRRDRPAPGRRSLRRTRAQTQAGDHARPGDAHPRRLRVRVAGAGRPHRLGQDSRQRRGRGTVRLPAPRAQGRRPDRPRARDPDGPSTLPATRPNTCPTSPPRATAPTLPSPSSAATACSPTRWGVPTCSGEDRSVGLAKELFRSVREFYLKLPDDVRVHPAHGAGSPCGANISDRLVTTLGYERQHNPALQIEDEAKFVEYVLSTAPPEPRYYPRMKEINARGPEVLGRLPTAPALPPKAFQRAVEKDDVHLVDNRQMLAFGGGHIAGALNIGPRAELSIWAGWMLDPDKPIFLVLPKDGDLPEVLRQFLRVGYTKFGGYLLGGMEEWANAGLPLVTLPQIDRPGTRGVLPPKELQILDVRTPSEWEGGHIQGARYIFLPELEKKLDRLDEGQAGGGVLRQRLPREPRGEHPPAERLRPRPQRAGKLEGVDGGGLPRREAQGAQEGVGDGSVRDTNGNGDAAPHERHPRPPDWLARLGRRPDGPARRFRESRLERVRAGAGRSGWKGGPGIGLQDVVSRPGRGNSTPTSEGVTWIVGNCWASSGRPPPGSPSREARQGAGRPRQGGHPREVCGGLFRLREGV